MMGTIYAFYIMKNKNGIGKIIPIPLWLNSYRLFVVNLQECLC